MRRDLQQIEDMWGAQERLDDSRTPRMQHVQLVRRRLTKKEKHQSGREAYGRKLLGERERAPHL